MNGECVFSLPEKQNLTPCTMRSQVRMATEIGALNDLFRILWRKREEFNKKPSLLSWLFPGLSELSYHPCLGLSAPALSNLQHLWCARSRCPLPRAWSGVVIISDTCVRWCEAGRNLGPMYNAQLGMTFSSPFAPYLSQLQNKPATTGGLLMDQKLRRSLANNVTAPIPTRGT